MQGNLLQEYEHKFEQLFSDQKLSKLRCDAGLKIVEKGQFFVTLDEEQGHEMKNLCREYTLPRHEKASRVRGWILGNTKIGQVMDVKVCLHRERYGVGILIESLFRDRTVSWVRVSVEHVCAGKLVAKAKPRLKPAATLSPILFVFVREKWIDINPERFRQDCFAAGHKKS